jgi:very-short-patch-repair endonuclease
LRAAGIEVVHIANDGVLNDADGVIETILLAMTSPSPAASRRPPRGRGLTSAEGEG